MEVLTGKIEAWLISMGVSNDNVGLWRLLIMIAAMVLIAYIAEKICRKCVVPFIRKVTLKTS